MSIDNAPSDLRSGVLGVITARGGSKGLPGKNLAELGGKPLVAWSVEAALKSGAVERLIISTDDSEIARAAEAYGAEVPFLRPDNLAQDSTPHLPVLQHALEWMERRCGFEPSYLVLLQPTSPLRIASDVTEAVRIAKLQDAEVVISVTAFHGHPSWLLSIGDEGHLLPWASQPSERRQDNHQAYLPNGAVFVVRPELIRSGASWYGPSTWPYVMPAERAIDIDSAWDLHMARLIVADREGSPPGTRS